MKMLLIISELLQWVVLLTVAFKVSDLNFEIKKLTAKDYDER